MLDQEETIEMKLPHCSFITQHAHEEIHATTGLIVPYKYNPCNIFLASSAPLTSSSFIDSPSLLSMLGKHKHK